MVHDAEQLRRSNWLFLNGLISPITSIVVWKRIGFVRCCLYNGPKPKEITNLHVFCVIYEFCNESKKVEGGGPFTTNFPSILIHRGMTEKTCEQFCQIAKRLSKSLFRRLFRFCKISISFLPITTLAIQNLVLWTMSTFFSHERVSYETQQGLL